MNDEIPVGTASRDEARQPSSRMFIARGRVTVMPCRVGGGRAPWGQALSPENSGRVQAGSTHPARSETCRSAMERKLHNGFRADRFRGE